MYPRLWVPQLRAHILSNLAWNTILLVVLPIIYVLLPQIVAAGHGYLRGTGYVPSEFEQRIFEDHWKIIGYSALFAFGASEVQGYLLRRMRAAPFINAPFQALIAELAQRAGLRFTPAIIFIPQGSVTAAAPQSVFFGGKVLVMGGSLTSWASLLQSSIASSSMRACLSVWVTCSMADLRRRWGPDLTIHFLALYADARGRNLRNRVAHGLLRPGRPLTATLPASYS